MWGGRGRKEYVIIIIIIVFIIEEEYDFYRRRAKCVRIMNGDGKYYKSFILLFKTASSLAEVQCHSNQAAEMAMVKLMMIMRRMLERKGDYIGEMRKKKG